jgi:hypothetical protein
VPSLLTHAVFRDNHPHGTAEVPAAYLGVAGAIGVLVCTVNLLRPRRLGFGVSAGETYRERSSPAEAPADDLQHGETRGQRRGAQALSPKIRRIPRGYYRGPGEHAGRTRQRPDSTAPVVAVADLTVCAIRVAHARRRRSARAGHRHIESGRGTAATCPISCCCPRQQTYPRRRRSSGRRSGRASSTVPGAHPGAGR